jgi:hypothetical protein
MVYPIISVSSKSIRSRKISRAKPWTIPEFPPYDKIKPWTQQEKLKCGIKMMFSIIRKETFKCGIKMMFFDDVLQKSLKRWWFPKIGVSPHHPFLLGIFHERNHPAMVGGT